MSALICRNCRAYLRQALRPRALPIHRSYSDNGPRLRGPADIEALLSKPTWSVRSLLPDPSSSPAEEITPKQLHHLLRLSALPQPKSAEEEGEMLKTLHSQLHFVRDVQSVDTEGIKPLQSIRDESEEGIRSATIDIDVLREALGKEEFRGRNRRPRRIKAEVVDTIGVEDWDVLGTASRTVDTPAGKYFVVKSGSE